MPFELFRQPGAEQLMLADDAAMLRLGYNGIPPAAIEEYVQLFSAPDVLTATLAYFRAFDFAQWLELPLCTVRTVFAWGSEDPFLDPATADATRDHVAGTYHAERLDAIGHWVPELATERVTELLLANIEG
jgi:pimeloyl-ACP methyl ester carboxylesterase